MVPSPHGISVNDGDSAAGGGLLIEGEEIVEGARKVVVCGGSEGEVSPPRTHPAGLGPGHLGQERVFWM